MPSGSVALASFEGGLVTAVIARPWKVYAVSFRPRMARRPREAGTRKRRAALARHLAARRREEAAVRERIRRSRRYLLTPADDVTLPGPPGGAGLIIGLPG